MTVTNTTANRGYQLPDATNKLKDDVLRLISALSAIDVDVAQNIVDIANRALIGHHHAIGDVDGLQAALDTAAQGQAVALDDLTDVDAPSPANNQFLMFLANGWQPAAIAIGMVTGLQAALDGKATPTDISTAIDNLVASAPGALDTLNELAAALGDDPNFSATMTNSLAGKLALTGGTLTGNLGINNAWASLFLNKPASGTALAIKGQMNGATRWVVNLGNQEPESGSNAGSNFTLDRYDDSGSWIEHVLTISRSTGSAYFARTVDAADQLTEQGQRVYSPNNPPPAGGQPIPTTSVLAVGTFTTCRNYSGGDLADGATVAGSNLKTAWVQRNATANYAVGTNQAGTWKNVSGVTVAGHDIGLFVRTA